MRRYSLVSFLLIICLLAACGTETSPSGVTSTPVATPTPEPAGTPLPAGADKRVQFMTDDNLKLTGWLYNSGKSTAIIGAHMYPSNKTDWSRFAPELTKMGVTVLVFDFHNFGESQSRPEEGEGNIKSETLDNDLLAAITFMQSQGANKIILMGASMGGTTVLRVAGKADVAAVIAVSVAYGTFIRGITIDKAMVEAITEPKMLVGSEFDGATEPTKQIFNDAKDPKELHIYPGADHGSNIFYDAQNREDFLKHLSDFLNKYSAL